MKIITGKLKERKIWRKFRMIRQNKDGRPIYKDSVWYQMIETGKKLIKLIQYKKVIRILIIIKLMLIPVFMKMKKMILIL